MTKLQRLEAELADIRAELRDDPEHEYYKAERRRVQAEIKKEKHK